SGRLFSNRTNPAVPNDAGFMRYLILGEAELLGVLTRSHHRWIGGFFIALGNPGIWLRCIGGCTEIANLVERFGAAVIHGPADDDDAVFDNRFLVSEIAHRIALLPTAGQARRFWCLVFFGAGPGWCLGRDGPRGAA
ncbi:MAG: hypothetical protein ACTH8R_10930, partial [Glutamicibacter arilaitensis]